MILDCSDFDLRKENNYNMFTMYDLQYIYLYGSSDQVCYLEHSIAQ